jgi:hypothetical protein
MKLYRYVGPRRLLDQSTSPIQRCEPASPHELRAWLSSNGYTLPTTLTYVVTVAGRLRVSDRNTEHVACARGEPVLAAGELELSASRGSLAIESVSNQSTGYCPEAESFPAVAAALTQAGFSAPRAFSHVLTFRRCPGCASISVVKDSDFECASCGSELPLVWNFDD